LEKNSVIKPQNKWLEYFILILIYLLPFFLITGPFLSDLVLVICSLYFLFITFKFKLIKYYQNKYVYFFLLFYIYILIRSFFSEDIYLSLEHSLFFFRYLFFILSIIYFAKKYVNFKYYLTLSLTAAITIIVFDAYIQFFFGSNLIGIKTQGNHLLTGFFGSRELMGYYLARLMPLLLALVFLNEDLLKKHFNKYIFLLFNTIIVIFLSGDRTEFLISLMSIFLIVILINRFKKIRLIIMFSIFFSVVLLFTINSDYKYRYFDNIIENSIQNDSTYFLTWHHHAMMQSSIKMFLDNPLFGQGTKMYRELCGSDKFKYIISGRDVDDPRGHSCSTHPHSWYLELLAENGLIGFSFIFIIFLMIALNLLKHFISLSFYKKEKFDDARICLMITIFTSFIPFVPSLSFFNNWGAVILVLSISLYLNDKNMIKK